MDATLQNAIAEAARIWDALPSDGDPNTIDMYCHARKIEELLQVRVPQELPSQVAGVALVELVESLFVKARLIRTLAPTEINVRAGALVDAIVSTSGLPDCSATQRYVAALYAWHGCINMAKLLRRTYVTADGEEPYTVDHRKRDYEWLSNCWSAESARGNPWVRYGVSLARLFEKNRKGDRFDDAVCENWVPGQSPYWDPIHC